MARHSLSGFSDGAHNSQFQCNKTTAVIMFLGSCRVVVFRGVYAKSKSKTVSRELNGVIS